MRHFFIRGVEIILGVILVLTLLGFVLGGIGLILNPEAMPVGDALGSGAEVPGPVAGVAILIVGVIYTIFIGGLMYLGLGIYHNTRRMAEALERQAS